MARSDVALRRARRAYEGAHVAAAAPALLVAGAACLLALGLYGMDRTTWLVAITLVVALPVLAWRGGAWRRGAFAGVLAGLPPLIVPAIVFALTRHGHCASCEMHPTLACILACFGSSSLVGLFVGHRAISDRSPRRFAVAAITTAALAGLLGCSTTGLGGAVGVVFGLVAGSVAGWLVAGRTVRA